MKKLICGIFFASLVALSAKAADTYTLDNNHTNIIWFANHFGFSNPSGKFAVSDGKVILDEADPTKSSVSIIIKTGSVQTTNSQFDSYLKGENFFNSTKFPDAKFVSTKVETQGKKARITGDFTMLGVTKPIVLDAKLNRIGINPITQRKTAGFSATTNIKRSDFGMNFGAPGVGDNVKLIIEAEAILDNKVASTAITNPAIPYQGAIANRPWVISTQGSKIEFAAIQEKSTITGSFEKFDGQIIFDPNNLTNSMVNIEIDTASLLISVPDALATLQSPAWFALAQYPKATFVTSQFTKTDNKNYTSRGKLTLKGRTIPIELNFSLDSYSDTNATVTGYTTLRRSDFNIGDRDIKKANGVKDEVKIKFIIVAYKR